MGNWAKQRYSSDFPSPFWPCICLRMRMPPPMKTSLWKSLFRRLFFRKAMTLKRKKKSFGTGRTMYPWPRQKKGSLSDDLKSNAEKQPHRISEVMLRILAFPVEQITPMECMGFESSISALANLRFRRRHSRLEKQLRSKEFLLEIHEIHPFLRSGQGGVEPSQILCFKRFF